MSCFVLVFSGIIAGSAWCAEANGEWPLSLDEARSFESLLAAGDLRIETVFCPYDTLYLNQVAVPIRVDLRNESPVSIELFGVELLITSFLFGNRAADYTLTGTDLIPGAVIPPGEATSANFELDVNPTALTDTEINVDAHAEGVRLDTFEPVVDSTWAESFRDEFNAPSYDGNDGTLDWSGDWMEYGETSEVADGDVQVTMHPISGQGYSLRIGGMGFHAGRGAGREADLSGATYAALYFDVFRQGLTTESDLLVEVSGNGGLNWTTILLIQGNNDVEPIPVRLDITPFISSNTQIRFITEFDGHGYVYFDNVHIAFTPGLRTDHWIVASEASALINAVVALFDTRGTIDRSDDDIIALHSGEQFPLNKVHYLFGGLPLAEIPYERLQYYRLVLQINPVSDWEWEPKESGEGYIAFSDTASGFGRLSAPLPGIKEFLVIETAVSDEEADPADILRGTTENFNPAVPWSMMTDPFTDPVIETAKTKEYGSIIVSPSDGRRIIDCRDNDKHWEVTGKCENDRYYFFETWFQPDLEWSHGDIADIYMYLRGKPDPNNVEELHVKFRMADDDTTGPAINDLNPEVVSEGQSFQIYCRITDPSDIYDDNTGIGGQGVYLVWDTDGELTIDYNEVQMSSAGGDYFITDTSLGPFAEGEEILCAVVACDNDFDNGNPADRSCTKYGLHLIQIVGSIYLIDTPYSLQPSRVYPGEESVTFHLSLTNPMPGGMWLFASSYITFSAGGDTIKANLSNDTWMETGATAFPISFDPVDIPADFPSPDTLDVILHLDGWYESTTYFTQSWILSPTNRLVVLEPTLHGVAHAIPSPSAHPGARKVELLRFELALESLYDVQLDSVLVSNATDGARAAPDNDANLGTLYLYRQAVPSGTNNPILKAAEERLDRDDSNTGIDESRDSDTAMRNRPPMAGDSLIATADLINGTAGFDIESGGVLSSWQSCYYYVLADVDSFLASDGDSLDIEISSPGSLFITGRATKLFHTTALNSEGKTAVDGCMSFQLFLNESLPDTLYSNDSDQPVFSLDIPANGYVPDVLAGLSIKNYGDNAADAVIENLKLWVDDGDGIFSNQSDGVIGMLQDTGDRFQVSGLAYSVADPKRLFVTAEFGENFSQEFRLGFGVPIDGVQYLSGNDGPLDSEIIPHTSQLLIRREYVVVESIAQAVEIGMVHPGDEDVELCAFRISNRTLGNITVDSIKVTGRTDMFACEPGKQVDLYIDNGDFAFDPEEDAETSAAAWQAGGAMFEGIDVDMAADGDAVFFVCADIDSHLTVDGDTLTVRIDAAEDIYLTLSTGNTFDINGQFPVESAVSRLTDGMLTYQVTLHPGMDTTIVDQRDDILILDFTVPGNGCLDDTLTAFVLVNGGSAGDEHIERVLLWRDTGDGLFSRQFDDSLAELSRIENRVYGTADLSAHLEGDSGERFYVTVDLKAHFSTGATIRAAIPPMGIAVASGNDGPLDDWILSDSDLLIPIPDRVTFYTSILDNKRVHPGARNVLNMVLGAYNSYTDPKELQSVILMKGGDSYPIEIAELAAYADSDNDGLFDPAEDDLLQIAKPTDIYYVFDDLGMILPSYKSSLLFIAYTLVDRAVRDSVSIDFEILYPSHIVFAEEDVNIEGEFALNSAGEDVTDGMVSGQIDLLIVKSARISPGDDDVPCFSFSLPCNGTLEDSLKSISLDNLGSAVPGQDIEYFKLWKETGGGSGRFDQGEEEFIGFIAWDGDYWSIVSELSEFIPCTGLALHVTADIAATAVEARTINLSLPLGGLEVLSGNDGPLDESLDSPAVITVTTDPLLSFFYPLAPVTRLQEFEVRMAVSNVSDSLLSAVEPDTFMYTGDGSLTMLSGPDPSAIDLPAHSDSSFSWTFRADAVGTIVFEGRVREMGGSAVSQIDESDTLLIEDIPHDFIVTLDDLSPVSLNRGQQDATLIEFTMNYDASCARCAGVDLVSLDILFMNGSGIPVPVRDVASHVRLEDESAMIYSANTSEIDQSLLEITLVDPVLFVPEDTKHFAFSIDVAGIAAVDEFMLGIQSADYIELEDHNSGAAVQHSGTAFPWSTQSVSLDDPATELVVHFNDVIPGVLNRGQEDVEAFELVISNVGDPGAADISVSEIVFETVDEAGDSVLAGETFRSIAITDQMGNPYFHQETFAPSASITCRLEPSVNVSAQIPVTLKVHIDCLSEPGPAGFSIMLRDSANIVARDINSGGAVPVSADTASGDAFPMISRPALFHDPLQAVSVSSGKLLPGMIAAGQSDVGALRIILEHTGESTESWSRCTGMTIRLLDETGEGLGPDDIIESVRVRSGETDLAQIYITTVHTSTIALPFSEDVVTPPGGLDSLEILLDVDPSAPDVRIQIHINAQDLEVSDATDPGSEVALEGSFPLTSGIGGIVLPAEEIAFGADALLSANVAAGSESDVFDLCFSRSIDSGGSLVILEGFSFYVRDEMDNLVDPSLLIDAINLEDESGPVACGYSIGSDSVYIQFVDLPRVAAGETYDIIMKLTISSQPGTDFFSLWIDSSSDVYCRDETSGNSIAVVPLDGGTFPYNSGRAAILKQDVEAAFANYPNPFVASSEQTRITFYMPGDGRATLQVFTVTGRLVKTLLAGERLSAGLHQDTYWDGRNGSGEAVLNGVYFLVLETNINGSSQVLKRKVALVR